MKMKMTTHNGATALVVTGTQQALVITEVDGCLTVEFADTVRHTPTPVPAPEYVQEVTQAAHVSPPVLADEVQDNTPQVPSDNTPPAPTNEGLFKQLVQLRKTIAIADKVPPYLVFHDKTLHEMVDKMPADMQAMGRISGVGQAKLDKYGTTFLNAINNVAISTPA